jgi:hypothetical protein
MRVQRHVAKTLLEDLGRSRRACMLTSRELARLARVSPVQLFLAEYHGLNLLKPIERERVARALAIFIRARRRELTELLPAEQRVFRGERR